MKAGNSDLINVSNDALKFDTTPKENKHKRNSDRIKGMSAWSSFYYSSNRLDVDL